MAVAFLGSVMGVIRFVATTHRVGPHMLVVVSVGLVWGALAGGWWQRRNRRLGALYGSLVGICLFFYGYIVLGLTFVVVFGGGWQSG